MRDALTTAGEIAGACLVVAGAWVLMGFGIGLIAAGIAVIGLSYLASGGSE